MPIGTCDISLSVCDPREMIKGDIIAICTYLYYLDNDTFSSSVSSDFLDCLCDFSGEASELSFDSPLPLYYFTWGPYSIKAIGRYSEDGIDLTLFRNDSYTSDNDSTDDSTDTSSDDDSTDTGDEDKTIPPTPRIREPFYVSPYEPFHWYDKYSEFPRGDKDLPQNIKDIIEQISKNSEEVVAEQTDEEKAAIIEGYTKVYTRTLTNDELFNSIEIYKL